MQFQAIFRHMESSDALRDKAFDKFQPKIEKYLNKPISLHTTFAVDGDRHQLIVRVVAANVDKTFRAETADMYSTVDILAEKMETALERIHDKRVHQDRDRMRNHLEEEEKEEDSSDSQ